MPVERILTGFKDLSMSFRTNPLNDDLIVLKDTNAIARSVRNLVLTAKGERFFNPNVGSGVPKLLFDNLDTLTATLIENEIQNVIDNYEPRVEVLDVKATPDFENNSFDIRIQFRVIGLDVPPQQLTFALQPTR